MSATTKLDPDISAAFWLGMGMPMLLAAWLIPAILLRAWVITMLWEWYIVPGFGAQPLRMSIAFGLSALVAMMTPSFHGKDDRTMAVKLSMPFFGPLMSLLIGWIGSFFV